MLAKHRQGQDSAALIKSNTLDESAKEREGKSKHTTFAEGELIQGGKRILGIMEQMNRATNQNRTSGGGVLRLSLKN